MNIYDVNQAMYASVPPITDFSGAIKIIKDYINDHPSSYYMLLNNEEKYYTIFAMKHKNKEDKFALELIDLVKSLGPVKDITVNSFGALEIWVEYQNQMRMFLLFDYARGVIEI